MSTSKLDKILAQSYQERESGYRHKALKMYPHFCGRCSREFSGKGLSELTVHHRDHNHDNNPSDGSNWELLCLYCMIMSTSAKSTCTTKKKKVPARKAHNKPLKVWQAWLIY